jgi:serine/threonine protein kinase
LVKEAIMLQKYQHKNIVKFIGISLLRKPFHLVIELIEGSLSNVLRKNANINVRKKLKFSKNGAEALLYLENNGAVHLYVFI